MLVRDRMTPNPKVIAADTSHPEALRILHKEKLHYLPVVDKTGHLVGIISEADLLHAAPSSASSLSIYEMNYLLANLKIHQVMSCPPITVGPETPLEEAARVLIERNIGCLPVLDGDRLVGLITETDIFRTFVEILGAGDAALRITLRSPNVPGELARLTALIASLGGNIYTTASFLSEDPQHVYFTFRLDGVDEDVLIPKLKEMGEVVMNVYHLRS